MTELPTHSFHCPVLDLKGNTKYSRDAMFAFKWMSCVTATYLSSFFLKRGEVSGRVTRYSHLLNIALFMNSAGQRTFFIKQFRYGIFLIVLLSYANLFLL